MAVNTLFFDAAGTLIQVRQPVGQTYAEVALSHGIVSSAKTIGDAFRSAWRDTPGPAHPPGQMSPDDDRTWWRNLVALTFARALGRPLAGAELHPLFNELYDHYGLPGAWSVFQDVVPVLQALHGRYRMMVLSNFDKRLHSVLSGHGLDQYFDGVVISSEVGASKPHPRIFEAALLLARAAPSECLHIGDEAGADVDGAQAMGIAAYHVKRPEHGLEGLLEML